MPGRGSRTKLARQAEQKDGRRRFSCRRLGGNRHGLDYARTSAIRASAPSPSINCAPPMASRSRGLLEGNVDLFLIETMLRYAQRPRRRSTLISEVCDDVGRDVAGHDFRHHHRPLRPACCRARCRKRSGIRCSTARPVTIGPELRVALPKCARISPNSAASPIRCLRLSERRSGPTNSANYDESPEIHGRAARRIRRSGLVNGHRRLLRHHAGAYAAIAKAVAGKKPRQLPEIAPQLRLSGLRAVHADAGEFSFVNVGVSTKPSPARAQIPPS